MPNNYGDILGALDGPGEVYPPFNHLLPYPKFLVVNIYGGYTLITDKLICLTNRDQMLTAHPLQVALAQIGIHWDISLHEADQGRENVGVQFEIKALQRGVGAYELEIEVDGIISLIANDLLGLEKGIGVLIQVIQLAFEKFGKEIASLWIRDWTDTSHESTK